MTRNLQPRTFELGCAHPPVSATSASREPAGVLAYFVGEQHPA